jgi:hypothetical protein
VSRSERVHSIWAKSDAAAPTQQNKTKQKQAQYAFKKADVFFSWGAKRTRKAALAIHSPIQIPKAFKRRVWIFFWPVRAVRQPPAHMSARSGVYSIVVFEAKASSSPRSLS